MAHDEWVEDCYLGSDGAMLKDTVTPDGYTVRADGKWTGYTEDQLLAFIDGSAVGIRRTYITADFNGDGRIEAVALMVDTGGRERDCTAYRWYTDGQNTYCYDQQDYWWLKEDMFSLITTEDGIHLGETIVARTAADWCVSSIFKFDEAGAERLFYGENIYMTGFEMNQVICEEQSATGALYGYLFLNTIQKGRLVYVDGAYSCDWLCRNLKETYYDELESDRKASMIIYADNAVDCGDYYKMDAEININSSNGPQAVLGEFHTEIRLKKDAIVLWREAEIIQLSLDEYANRFEPAGANREFSSCRMWDVVQDEQGYIIEFSDVNAG
ncbi:MAG: hypothetical protein LUE86_02575 [Clostridiales bacterium]|nr:hypothetical protein [Clostridiales bacterium]